jgi:adenylate kinase family enzyme
MNYNIEVITNVVLEERKLSNINTISRLSKLLKECFDLKISGNLNITELFKGSDFFLCSHKDKIVGMAGVKINAYSVVLDTVVDTYNTDKYIINNNNKIYDTHANKVINENTQNTDPRIHSLCKNKDYKNVGSTILRYIEEYYRKKGTTKIYLTAGSDRNYNILKNSHIHKDTEAIKKYNKIYKQDNQNLIKYYIKNGYEIVDNYYEYDYIKLEDGIIITFFNTLCKNI